LGTLQNKAIKSVTFATYTEHATPSYVELNVLKFPDLFRHEIAKLINNILRNNHPPNFSNFFLLKQIESTIEQLVLLQTNMHYMHSSIQNWKIAEEFQVPGN